MNKKIQKVTALICVMLLLFTGCVRYEANLKINKNGTIDISIIYAESSEMVGATSLFDDSDSSVLSQEQIDEYKSQGYTVSEYQASGYTGYTISKQGVKVQGEAYDLTNTGVTIVHTRKGLVHTLDIDLSQSEDVADIANFAPYITQTGGNMSFSIELPVEAKNHNATSVSADGKTLTWDMLTMNIKEPIHVEFQLVSYGLIAGAGALVVAAIVAFVVLKKKSHGEKVPEGGFLEQGNAYYYGEGVKMNLEKAFNCYSEAAKEGNAEAMCLLGYCYKKGIGTAVNESEAFKLFNESAELGFPMAMFNLGECYEKGIGCDIDIEKSNYYYNQASSLGYTE